MNIVQGRIVPAGPGHVDTPDGPWFADVSLDLDPVGGSEGSTVAVLHLGLSNLESNDDSTRATASRYLVDVQSVGVELTIGDIESLITDLCATLIEARKAIKENQSS